MYLRGVYTSMSEAVCRVTGMNESEWCVWNGYE